MQQKSINIFVNLLESIIRESSTTADLVKSVKGADILIPYMHKHLGLSHNQTYEEHKKLAWSEIKTTGWRRELNWVIVKGDLGVGAIAATDEYHAIAVYDNQVVDMKSERGGDVLRWLKTYVGKIQTFYVGGERGEATKKREERKIRKPIPAQQYTDIDNFLHLMMKKFKPVWIKSIEQAQADIKGFVGTQIKNNAYEKANKKLGRLKMLDDALQALDDGKNPITSERGYRDPFDIMRIALKNAILLTAHHYYPEETGGFRDRQRGQHSLSVNDLNKQESVKHLFDDIRDGDTKKLTTLLGFFKKGLISA